jgi:hypothetical protein
MYFFIFVIHCEIFYITMFLCLFSQFENNIFVGESNTELEKTAVRSFIMYTLNRILWGWSNQGGWDGWGMWHAQEVSELRTKLWLETLEVQMEGWHIRIDLKTYRVGNCGLGSFGSELGSVAGYCGYGNEPSSSIKGGELID